MVDSNGFDPNFDFDRQLKEFDINYEIYGNIYGVDHNTPFKIAKTIHPTIIQARKANDKYWSGLY